MRFTVENIGTCLVVIDNVASENPFSRYTFVNHDLAKIVAFAMNAEFEDTSPTQILTSNISIGDDGHLEFNPPE